jgi:hypothetical protein
MPRAKRGKNIPEINIETHPLNERLLPQLHIKLSDIQWVKDNMPVPAIMDSDIHGWTHVLHMLAYASELREYSDFDLDVVKWAIVVHDSGRYTDGEESMHGLMGAYIFARMCKKARDAEQPIDVREKHVIGIVGRHSKTDYALSTEEAVVRTCDRLDLWRLDNFTGFKTELMQASGWKTVQKLAWKLRRGVATL